MVGEETDVPGGVHHQEDRPMIRKVKGGYVVLSEKGKRLSKVLPSLAAAKKRLAQVEYWKHKHG